MMQQAGWMAQQMNRHQNLGDGGNASGGVKDPIRP